jgi:hypothetical protein
MMVRSRLYWVLPAAVLMGSAPDDPEVSCKREIDAMGSFLAARENLVCAEEADCVIVETGCHTFERGACNEAPLNRKAARSSRWGKLRADLKSCCPAYEECLAGLLSGCSHGFCGGPRRWSK